MWHMQLLCAAAWDGNTDEAAPAGAVMLPRCEEGNAAEEATAVLTRHYMAIAVSFEKLPHSATEADAEKAPQLRINSSGDDMASWLHHAPTKAPFKTKELYVCIGVQALSYLYARC